MVNPPINPDLHEEDSTQLFIQWHQGIQRIVSMRSRTATTPAARKLN